MTSRSVPVTRNASTAKRNLPRIYLLEAKYEFLKLLRIPAFSISTMAFPLMFYLIFSSTFGRFQAQGIDVAAYLMVSYGALGTMNAALFGFGAGIAGERGQGWMLLKRVSPMPPLAYFVAKTVMAALFSLLTIVGLSVLAFLLNGVLFPIGTWLALVGVIVVGVVPFAALGLFFGYLLGPNSAVGVLNLVSLPMAFASGMWIPISQLPGLVQHIALYLPAYHFVQLVLASAGGAALGSALVHVLALMAFTVVFLALALWAYRRDEGRTYG